MDVVLFLLIVLVWVFVGFAGFLISVAAEMRGKGYDWWFYKDIGTIAVVMCIAGPIGFVVGIIMGVASTMSRKDFGKFIHKLVNVGTKNKEKLFD